MTGTLVNQTELEELGFTQAAGNVKAKRELARKMRIAFEHFRVVTPEYVDAFNDKLKKATSKQNPLTYSYNYQKLVFTSIDKYPEVPPVEALTALKEARKLACFDNYEVATIQSVTIVPDPILFGRINGCNNYYFIAQWDDDVKIEDILKDDEG